jgi:alpha-tubulin suppressor-like RCC1 family protein
MGINSLFVTDGYKVFTFGSNTNELLYICHKCPIIEPLILNELSKQKFIDFANGIHHVIARTAESKVYIWGYNYFGQLGVGTKGNDFVPHLLNGLSEVNLTNICCGDWHTLALTSNGKVYAWDNNQFGHIGNECDDECQLTPLKIEELDEELIVAISCGVYHSLALTETGRVYNWSDNEFKKLGFANIIASNVSKLIKTKDSNELKLIIEGINCDLNYNLLLSSNGDIYVFGCNDGQMGNDILEKQFIPTKILSKNKFIDIATSKEYNISVAQPSDGIYYIWGFCGEEIITKLKPTQFNSFNEIFVNYCNITYKLVSTVYTLTDHSLIDNKISIYYISLNSLNSVLLRSEVLALCSKQKIRNKMK